MPCELFSHASLRSRLLTHPEGLNGRLTPRPTLMANSFGEPGDGHSSWSRLAAAGRHAQPLSSALPACGSPASRRGLGKGEHGGRLSAGLGRTAGRSSPALRGGRETASAAVGAPLALAVFLPDSRLACASVPAFGISGTLIHRAVRLERLYSLKLRG